MLTKMNLKYYLRGLGIGIIVTALIMGIVTGGKGKALSDEEIIKRAEQLGMTMESDVLSEALPEAEEEEAPMQEDASAQAELQDNAMENGEQDPQNAEAAPQEEGAEEGTEQQTEESIPDEEAEESRRKPSGRDPAGWNRRSGCSAGRRGLTGSGRSGRKRNPDQHFRRGRLHERLQEAAGSRTCGVGIGV